MQLLPLRDLRDDKLASICAAVQNVCNATLSLLFTISLVLWGFFVNRKKAWRTDGGTAAFGAGAITLALASTAITFVYIPHRDQYDWLPGLMWAVILWQSFLGWWWWVGSGMSIGEVDEYIRRQEKKKQKRWERKERRRERREKAETFLKGFAGALGFEGKKKMVVLEEDEDEHHEDQVSHRGSRRRRGSDNSAQASISESTDHSSGILKRIVNHSATRMLYGWFLLLRHAHFTAAQEQAAENVEKIQQVYGESQDPSVDPYGWGLGSYGIRQRGAEMRQSMERARDVPGDDDAGSDIEVEDDTETEMANNSGDVRRRRQRPEPDIQEEIRSERGDVAVQNEQRDPRPSSLWWWGPLRRWRLQDSTNYP